MSWGSAQTWTLMHLCMGWWGWTQVHGKGHFSVSFPIQRSKFLPPPLPPDLAPLVDCPNPCRTVFFFSFFFSVRQYMRLCLYRWKPKPFAQQKGSSFAKADGAMLLAVALSCNSCLIQPKVSAEPISAMALDLQGKHVLMGLKRYSGCSKGLRWAVETPRLHLLLLAILVTVCRITLQPLLWLNHWFWSWHLVQVVLEEQRYVRKGVIAARGKDCEWEAVFPRKYCRKRLWADISLFCE